MLLEYKLFERSEISHELNTLYFQTRAEIYSTNLNTRVFNN
jgi:hypothetical protein